MKYALAIVLTVILSVVASAQQQPFVPYIVTEQDHNALIAWLNEQPIPPKYANPIMNRLNTLEQMAITQKDHAAAARAEQDKTPK